MRIYNRVLTAAEIQSDMNTPLGAGGSNSSPVVTLSSSSLDFSSQQVGTSSASKSAVLTNTGSAPLSIGSISISGANSADFGQTNNCGISLAANSSCSINVIFTPAGAGARTATLTITDNAAGSPHTVGLTGTGTTAAKLSISPRVTDLTFHGRSSLRL